MQLKLSRLKKIAIFMQHLRLDVTPEMIFKPRFIHTKDDVYKALEIRGFSFYIESLAREPRLIIMKSHSLTSKTMGEVDDVPEELLKNAVSHNGIKDIGGMYPIDDGLAEWIRKELGLSPKT